MYAKYVRAVKLLGMMWACSATLGLNANVQAAETDAFPQLLERFKAHPEDKALQATIVKAAHQQATPPTVPEEARRFFIRGNTALEDAKGSDGYVRAARHYREALKLAPWWPEAYQHLGKALDLAKDYSGAIDAFTIYLLTQPAQPEARQVQDHIYALEEKRDEAQEALSALPNPTVAAPVVVIQDAVAPHAVPLAPQSSSEKPVLVLQPNVREPGIVFRDCNDCPDLVTLTPSYAMGKYLVTQKQWRSVMGVNPSAFKDCGDDCPVENISYNDVQEFIAKLNEKTGKTYRLPTEAQWEFACQAASPTQFCGGAQFESVAWFLRNSGAKTHPVGKKQPNALGLYDMNGNVWEWTSDCGGDDCRYRVLRGGSWTFDPQFAGARKRIAIDVNHRLNDYGFRLVRALP